MGRRGGPRPGAAGLPILGPALAALLCVTGCDRPADPPHPTPVPAPTRATASPPSDADLCTRLVAHWARAALDSGTYGDYQSMGLSNGQYDILRDVVTAARAVRRRQGLPAAHDLIDRQAGQACTERYRHGARTGGPWT
ncbi:hypothetical protein GCM10010503_51820 [Streptomyces lucensis JCM 4490]|uniref:Lipoprotein n=1 Tax=Streptomyces lucensis JCM 4490 TaxID=1306176 RepID=A0A918MSS4_9ACTN|nr:hypothetical protein [Streptomyces lucensis]GGW68164.1 hypothetical protein GCM10010503_51820 [Streptomyces lucensis JCM 4490]